MRVLLTLALTVSLAIAAALSACGTSARAPERGAEVRVRWVLPDAFRARVTLHRAPGDRREAPAWLMKTYTSGEATQIAGYLGEEITGGNLRVALDEPQYVVVVVENPLDRAVRFWVAPHLPTPHSAEDALLIRCLCTGETYEVPANGVWTRVAELGVRRRQSVDTLIVTHVITLGDAPALTPPR